MDIKTTLYIPQHYFASALTFPIRKFSRTPYAGRMTIRLMMIFVMMWFVATTGQLAAMNGSALW